MIVLALVALVIACFAGGMVASPWRTLVVPVVAGTLAEYQLASTFNPLFLMVTIGPWAVGATLRSRRRLAHELESASTQLEVGRAQYSAEKLRYERFRLARELHDTVAHWLTAIVVQAAAGSLLIDIDPQRAVDTFILIEEAAKCASSEVERAVALVGSTSTMGNTVVCLTRDLPTLATMTGVQLHLMIDEDVEISVDVSTTALRLVQEGVTNAMKHAPGALVEVTVRATEYQLVVDVNNGKAKSAQSHLDDYGSGFGLIGLSQRIEEIGGTFEAGPTAEEGWRLAASIDL